MKLNKWTIGLAALGVVSMGSAARAEESLNAVQTALASTTISGYVDTSFEWQLKPDKETPDFSIPFRGSDKLNGFNLNVVKLSIEKPLDESEWAAGYKVDLLFGPDAVGYNSSVRGLSSDDYYDSSSSDFGIKQAYVALRTPVGNGIDWKMGVFDTIVGYEVFESGNNPNFTRSWGYAIEPTQHTGLLGSYRVNDMISFSGGIANTLSPGINNRNSEVGDNNGNPEYSYGRKTWMASIAVTAPDDAGFLAGSTFYGGVVGGYAGSFSGKGGSPTGPKEDQYNYYVGATMATPVEGLKVGLAFDYVTDFGGFDGAEVWTIGGYASFQATEKLSFHGRIEYGEADANSNAFLGTGEKEEVWGLTGTVQYSLWNNVISRLEVRWDQVDPKDESNETAVGLYANVIYKF